MLPFWPCFRRPPAFALNRDRRAQSNPTSPNTNEPLLFLVLSVCASEYTAELVTVCSSTENGNSKCTCVRCTINGDGDATRRAWYQCRSSTGRSRTSDARLERTSSSERSKLCAARLQTTVHAAGVVVVVRRVTTDFLHRIDARQRHQRLSVVVANAEEFKRNGRRPMRMLNRKY